MLGMFDVLAVADNCAVIDITVDAKGALVDVDISFAVVAVIVDVVVVVVALLLPLCCLFSRHLRCWELWRRQRSKMRHQQ